MENNRAYLSKIHWVFLLAIANGITDVLYEYSWTHDILKTGNVSYFIAGLFYSSFRYVSLGIATSKWREVKIAWVISLVANTAYCFLLPGTENAFNPLFYYFTGPVSLVVFFALQTGWKKKLILAYLLALSINEVGYSYFYASRNIGDWLNSIFPDLYNDSSRYVFIAILSIPIFVFHIIYLCEVQNYMSDKKYMGKATLINLRNEYDKRNSILTFLSLNFMPLIIIGGCLSFADFYIRSETNVKSFEHFADLNALVSVIFISLFLAWYMRKFLLENFIGFNHHSKLLYFFSLLPIIGFVVFWLSQSDAVKQQRYNEKLDTIEAFAASRTSSITVLLFGVLSLLLAGGIFLGDTVTITSLIAGILLLAWLIKDKRGYYLYSGICTAALVVLILFISQSTRHYLPLLLSILVLLIMLLPIYHFNEFGYMPAENPDPGEEKKDLFRPNLY